MVAPAHQQTTVGISSEGLQPSETASVLLEQPDEIRLYRMFTKNHVLARLRALREFILKEGTKIGAIGLPVYNPQGRLLDPLVTSGSESLKPVGMTWQDVLFLFTGEEQMSDEDWSRFPELVEAAPTVFEILDEFFIQDRSIGDNAMLLSELKKRTPFFNDQLTQDYLKLIDRAKYVAGFRKVVTEVTIQASL